MEERKNAGYTIIQSLMIGNAEFVIGHHPSAPAPYVTWECMNGDYYFWGHYCNNRMEADRDLLNRANVELERQEQRAGWKTENYDKDGAAIVPKPKGRGDSR